MTFAPAPAFTTRPTIRGTFGVAASTHWLASAAAQSVLERGGNAFDAAVAAGFVLHIVEPHLNGPGGDLTGLFRTTDGELRVLMGQGPAPAGATLEHYRDVEGLADVPGAGALAAAVPGSVDAWFRLLAEHGTWELGDVLEYALGYAEHGHPVHQAVVVTLERIREHFLEHWPTSAALWLDADGNVPRPGDLIVNPAYASVLKRLVAAGEGRSTREERIEAARREWKTGFVAQSIDAFVRTPHRHSDGCDHAGVLRASDLAAFDACTEDAVTYDFHGFTVAKTGPWGQGPVLLQMLAILDAYGRRHGLADQHLDPSTAFGIHVIAEAEKLALADRDAWYADPTFADVPLATLLSSEYAAERAALIGETASAELRPGSPDGRAPYLPAVGVGAAKDGLADTDDPDGDEVADAATLPAGIGEPTVDRNGQTRGDTCHLDVADRWGNVVTVTPSGGWLQSSPTVPELGFCLGTRLQMAWLDEASPSVLRPGARPRTTLSATLVTASDGDRVMSLGTPGGDQQDQWQLPALLRMLVGGWDPQAAIDAPTFHTTSHVSSFWPRVWEPAGLVVEDRVGDDVIAELERRGHRVMVSGPWTLGRLSGVGIELVQGSGAPRLLWSAANPRGVQGYATGR
ncbi:gamma-glutamyltransferase family protein [Humibacter sp. RRB41]|uniref:gamma-glutamyltransferase family protein n=1 Tax=Humibacter sp. RRB41 TaxID=2919946 RepID=UPI001FA97F2A|nr:gamma-glutamyltransferase [Humibacter sp. RRB41]